MPIDNPSRHDAELRHRQPEAGEAVRAYADAGQDEAIVADDLSSLEAAISSGRQVVATDPTLVAMSHHVDILLKVTGAMEETLRAVLAAIEHGKHIALMNTALYSTVDPILKVKADTAGVVYTNVDGDQPGVEVNLIDRLLAEQRQHFRG